MRLRVFWHDKETEDSVFRLEDPKRHFKIKGLQKTSLVDYPGKIASTVFFSGCNMRCGFCHNAELVRDSKKLKEYSEDEIISFLSKRKKVLDGVCLTGGEPTLYNNLKGFIAKIKKLGLSVKLDTNGLRPDVLREVISMADYVAMDIKSSREKYSMACGCKVDISKISESVDIIKSSDVDYEFRSTLVPEFFSEDDIVSIGDWLDGAKRYALQQFVIKGDMLDPRFMRAKPYDIAEIRKMSKLLKPYFNEVLVRA